MTQDSSTYLLIDGDYLLFYIGTSIEKETNWGGDEWVLSTDEREYIETVEAKIQSLAQEHKAIPVPLFSGDNNYRKDVVRGYKASRKAVRKPMRYTAVREYVEKKYSQQLPDSFCLRHPKLEADDLISIYASRYRWKNVIIWSPDKDFDQVPCPRINPLKPDLFPTHPRIIDAKKSLITQVLMGDRVDGYFGIKGVGIKKATELVELFFKDSSDLSDVWKEVVKAYKNNGMGEEDALENMRAARLMKFQDIDKNLNIRIWEVKHGW